jgi:hypothetical protein
LHFFQFLDINIHLLPFSYISQKSTFSIAFSYKKHKNSKFWLLNARKLKKKHRQICTSAHFYFRLSIPLSFRSYKTWLSGIRRVCMPQFGELFSFVACCKLHCQCCLFISRHQLAPFLKGVFFHWIEDFCLSGEGSFLFVFNMGCFLAVFWFFKCCFGYRNFVGACKWWDLD